MKPPPTSIFTGSSVAPATPSPETHRLSTPAPAPAPETPWPSPSPSPSPLPAPAPAPAPAARRDLSPPTSAAAHPPPALAGTKRPPSLTDPLLKRRRVSQTRQSLRSPGSFARPASLPAHQPPLSPLFFSHSRRARPHLPARFSSSEAAARMLSTAREDGAIKTVTLARGTFSGLSPPPPTTAPSRRSSHRSSLPRTASPDPLRLLGSVGVVELLEHDTRPTFIVDIADLAHHAPDAPPLHILFANTALRSSPPTWDLVAGNPSTAHAHAHAHASTQFKAWLLGTLGQPEGLDVNPSPVEHGGLVWSCYTLRKRLRVVSSAAPGPPTSTIPSTSASLAFAAPAPSKEPTSTTAVEPSPPLFTEPRDYFGTAPVLAASKDSDQQPPPALSPEHVPLSEAVLADKPSIVPFQRPDKLGLLGFSDSPSFTNECVLRANAAGDIDAFHRAPNPCPPVDHDVGFFDWTRLSLSPSLPRHIQFARSIDWASTPLGPIDFWSNDLRAMCNLIM